MSFFRSLKGYHTYLKISKKNETTKRVCIYSEGLNYRNYFIEIIEALKREKIEVLYFTSDTKDLELICENIKPIFIGKGIIRILFFYNLKMSINVNDLNRFG